VLSGPRAWKAWMGDASFSCLGGRRVRPHRCICSESAPNPRRTRRGMPRTYPSSSPQTPLILWICAAICAHFFMGGGTEEVSKRVREYRADRQYLSMLGTKTRERVRQNEQTL